MLFRSYLEEVLQNETQRQKIGAETAERIQKMLDEQHKAMWKTVWSNDEDLAKIGSCDGGRNAPEGFWNALVKDGKELPGYWSGPATQIRNTEAREGQKWWFESGWQKRNRELFELAGMVQKTLSK